MQSLKQQQYTALSIKKYELWLRKAVGSAQYAKDKMTSWLTDAREDDDKSTTLKLKWYDDEGKVIRDTLREFKLTILDEVPAGVVPARKFPKSMKKKQKRSK